MGHFMISPCRLKIAADGKYWRICNWGHWLSKKTLKSEELKAKNPENVLTHISVMQVTPCFNCNQWEGTNSLYLKEIRKSDRSQIPHFGSRPTPRWCNRIGRGSHEAQRTARGGESISRTYFIFVPSMEKEHWRRLTLSQTNMRIWLILGLPFSYQSVWFEALSGTCQQWLNIYAPSSSFILDKV